MRKMLLKGLMVVAAMLVCLSASAIDKVVKSTGLDNEVTSLEELKAQKVILQNAEGQMLYIPGVGGETSWDFKMTDLVNGLTSNNGAFLSAIDYDGHLIFQVFNLNGDERATPGWAGGKAYLNTQPEGKNVIFGLAGMNDQHGQDGPNLAVWDVEYVEGQGFSFHNVGRDIYLGYDATDARPSTSVVYWKAYTAYHASYVPEEVEAAYEQAIAAARTTETIAALEAAKSTFDSSADLNAFGDAVNAAIDAVNACLAVNAEYANLDEAGAAVAADVLAKYENKEYANIAELRAAYILAAKAQTTAGANMTGAIVNPSFELGTLEGWTSTDGGAIALNYNFAQRTGDKFVERWTPAPGKLSDGSLLQTLTDMPNGKYTLTAEMHNMEQGNNSVPGTGFYLVANDDKTAVAAHGETVTVSTVVTDGTIIIGTKLIDCSGNWICEDNFQLTYLGPVASDEDLAPLTAEIANAKLLGVDVSAWEGKTFAASEVSAAVEAVKVAEYKSVLAAYPFNAGSLIPAFDAWEGGMVSKQEQHWDGTSTSTYYEQTSDQWKESSWTNSKTTTVNLPKGKYVIYAAGRNSAGTACTSYIKVNDKTQNFPAKGDTGFGIATDGTATFDPSATYANNNAGRGWEYRYFAFEVTAEEGESVTLTVGGEASAEHQWMSVCVPVLLATSDNLAIAKQTLAADIAAAQAIVDAKAGVGDGLFLIPEEAVSTFSAAVEAAKVVNSNAEATNEEVAAAIAALAAATKTYKETPVNVPAADKQYLLTLYAPDGTELFPLSIVKGKISIEEAGTPITFVAKEGGKYALSNGTEEIYYSGSNNWDLDATTEGGYAWSISILNNGKYHIEGKLSGRYLGTNNNEKAAGSKCYGDKKPDANVQWAISEYVAPAPTYAIAIAEGIENGTIKADVETAKAGATVTLTATPAEGYKLEAITVTAGEASVEVTKTEGAYTFVMPAAAVTVSATFVAEAIEPEPVDPNLIEIAQSQGKDLDDFARTELVEGKEYNTYTANDNLQIAMKMMNIDVADCDYIVIKFAEEVAAGWKLGVYKGTDLLDIPEGVKEFKYVFADDSKCEVTDGVLPQICMMTFFGGYTAPLVAKVEGVYKHKIASEPVEPTTYTIAIAEGIENGTIAADVETAAEGATVTLTATPAEGYKLVDITVKAGDASVEVTEAEGAYTFAMPAAAVTVSATFVAETIELEVAKVENMTLTVAKDAVISDKDKTFPVVFGYTATVDEAIAAMASGWISYTVTAEGKEPINGEIDFDVDKDACNIPIPGLDNNTDYTITINSVSVSYFDIETLETQIAFEKKFEAGKLTATFNSGVPVGINGVAAGAKANRKVVENGRVVIYKNGVKTMSSGVSIR